MAQQTAMEPEDLETLGRDIAFRLGAKDGLQIVDDPDVIRSAALSMFTRYLDGKIANLQDGEILKLQFLIEIVGRNGRVRAGSGAERNMPEYIAWRSAVYERDKYTCQECGEKGGRLEAHHVEPWSRNRELRFDVSNGVTLCAECHKLKHAHLRVVDREAS